MIKINRDARIKIRLVICWLFNSTEQCLYFCSWWCLFWCYGITTVCCYIDLYRTPKEKCPALLTSIVTMETTSVDEIRLFDLFVQFIVIPDKSQLNFPLILNNQSAFEFSQAIFFRRIDFDSPCEYQLIWKLRGRVFFVVFCYQFEH